jgi:two-component system invasion response regulator UvrY
MKIVLVDDHDVVRHGLKLLLSGWKHVGVSGSFSSAEEMFTQCKDFSKVDLILLDEQLKGIKGSEALKRMRNQGIETPVILLSVEEEAKVQMRIDGLPHVKVLNKTIAPETLRSAIQSFVKHHSKKQIDLKDPVYMRSLISSREMEFLVHLCHENEYTYEQIAHIMRVHVRTVDGFRKSLFQKLNIRSKTGLVMLAIRNGWV